MVRRFNSAKNLAMVRPPAHRRLQRPAPTTPRADPVPSLSDQTAPRFSAFGPKNAPSIWPVAEPDRLNVVFGLEVAAVPPLNRLVPPAMLALTDTSFQGRKPPLPFACCM